MTKDQFGCFDMRVLQELSRALVRFSAGTRVRLTDQRLGEIVFIPPKTPTQPLIRLDPDGELVSLAEHPELAIDTLLT
jgi:HD-GYP domain-containing protein (c-di-GMP phosphodiesterase class II)